MERALAAPIEWRGKVFHRADIIPEPHYGHPARPYDISIKGDFGNTSGTLSITKVCVVDEVVRVVMFPPRGGVYDKRNAIPPRPYYFERDATGKRHKVFKVFCGRCGDYQRREAFHKDASRANGLQGMCKTCKSILDHQRYLRGKERLAQAA